MGQCENVEGRLACRGVSAVGTSALSKQQICEMLHRDCVVTIMTKETGTETETQTGTATATATETEREREREIETEMETKENEMQ